MRVLNSEHAAPYGIYAIPRPLRLEAIGKPVDDKNCAATRPTFNIQPRHTSTDTNPSFDIILPLAVRFCEAV